MHCSTCETKHRPGGTHLGSREAIGICLRCGGGVCASHATRDARGALVCETCALEPAVPGAPARFEELEAVPA